MIWISSLLQRVKHILYSSVALDKTSITKRGILVKEIFFRSLRLLMDNHRVFEVSFA